MTSRHLSDFSFSISNYVVPDFVLTVIINECLLFQCHRQTLPEGAEIKIAGVGSTPVAVSTQLPAAVVQLSQKGKITF